MIRLYYIAKVMRKVTSMIMSHYLRPHFRTLMLETPRGRDEASSHAGKAHMARNCRQPLGNEGSLQSIVSKRLGPLGLCDDLDGWDGVGEGGLRGRGYRYTYS